MITERHVECQQGHRHWGSAGAAGILFRKYEGDEPWYLLQHRSDWVHHPNTWGIPGGAINDGEAPARAAVREFNEEVRADVPWLDLDVAGAITDDHGGWAYRTIVVDTPEFFRARPAGETGHLGLQWVRGCDLRFLDLHPGLSDQVDTIRNLERRTNAAA